MLILTLILHQFLIRPPHAAHIHIDVDVHRALPLPIPPSSLPSSIPRARSSPHMRRRLASRLSTLQRFFLFETARRRTSSLPLSISHRHDARIRGRTAGMRWKKFTCTFARSLARATIDRSSFGRGTARMGPVDRAPCGQKTPACECIRV